MYKHGTHYKYQVIHRVACFCINIIKTRSSRKDYPLIYIVYAKAQIPWVLHLYDIFPWLEDQSLAVNALTSKELFGTKDQRLFVKSKEYLAAEQICQKERCLKLRIFTCMIFYIFK